jgi:hypothetical protein
MAEKRGRPISTDSTDPQILRRRQLTAARTQLYRERQRAARTAATTQPTPDQLSHGERVVDAAFTEQDAAETLTQLGLRVQGVTLAQDPHATAAQDRSFAVNDHHQLYNDAHRPADSVSLPDFQIISYGSHLTGIPSARWTCDASPKSPDRSARPTPVFSIASFAQSFPFAPFNWF